MRIRGVIAACIGVLATSLIAGCSTGSPSGPDTPSVASGEPGSSAPMASSISTPIQGNPTVDPATRDQITAVTSRAIEAFNTGNLTDLQEISCGALRTDLNNADAETFAAEARSDLDLRGRGSVLNLSDLTVLDQFASAAVTVRYEHHVEGLNPDNEIQIAGVYEKSADTWKICGLN